MTDIVKLFGPLEGAEIPGGLCRPVRARLQSPAHHHAEADASSGPSANSHRAWHRVGKRAGQTGQSAIEDHAAAPDQAAEQVTAAERDGMRCMRVHIGWCSCPAVR